MKNITPERVRLIQAAVGTRDSLRRLAARIMAAGGDPQRQAEVLAAAHQVAVTHSDMLRMVLKDSRTGKPARATEEAKGMNLPYCRQLIEPTGGNRAKTGIVANVSESRRAR